MAESYEKLEVVKTPPPPVLVRLENTEEMLMRESTRAAEARAFFDEALSRIEHTLGLDRFVRPWDPKPEPAAERAY